MPSGPWGYGMDKCIAWVKEHKKDVTDPGAYCGAIKRDQGTSKALDLKDVSYPALVPLHNEEVAALAELLVMEKGDADGIMDAALMLKTEMEDRGMNWSSFFGKMADEVSRWSVGGHERAVPIINVFKYMPQTICEPVDILLIGEAVERGFVGRYGSVTLRINKTERSEALENEILAKIGCPHVREKIRFTWGVDPSDVGLPIFDKGIICPYSPESGCGCELSKSVWDTAYINNLPDSCFAYISPGGSKDGEGKTTPRSLRHLPYKDKDGKSDAAHVRNALARLNQTQIPASAKASAHRKLVSAARGLGIKVAEKVGKSKVTTMDVIGTSIFGTDHLELSEPRVEKIVRLEAIDRNWRIEGDTATLCSVPAESILIKINKTTTDHEAPYHISRDGRSEVFDFDEWVFTETIPLSGVYKVSKSVPEHTFPYVMHRDTVKDAVIYKMFIVRGDSADTVTMDKPLGSDDVRMQFGGADLDDVEYTGRHRINGTMVNTEIIGKGMVTLVNNVMTIDGKVYTLDAERGAIINK